MRSSEQIQIVGIIGLANTVLFLAYAVKRLLRLRQSNLSALVFRRKLQTHRLLFLTGVCDLPMFAYFTIESDYSRAAYSIHSIGKIGLLISLGLLMDEWCSVLYMNEHVFPRPQYLSKAFLVCCVTAASCCMMVNAGLIATHKEFSENHEDVYEALLIIFVCLCLGLCTLTLYTAYVLWRKLMYLGEISHASPHQTAMRTASSRLLVNMNIFITWIVIQVCVPIASLYTSLRPRHTQPGLVFLYWCLSAYIPLWAANGVLLKLSGIRPKQSAPASPAALADSESTKGRTSALASPQPKQSAKERRQQRRPLIEADHLVDIPLSLEEDIIA